MSDEKVIAAIEAFDKDSNEDIIAIIKEKSGEILHFSSYGVIVRHRENTLYVLPFDDSTALFSYIDEKTSLFSVRGDVFAKKMLSHFSLEMSEPCYFYIYRGERKGVDETLFYPVPLSDAALVSSQYRHHSDLESIKRAINENRIFGLYENSELVAFSGFHEEGSMGMLEVFPSYRRKGYGMMMEEYVINRAMELGRVPFCDVYISNEASIALQEKLFLERAESLHWWMWRK
ncbi:MAG TPA: GNAT family N-acetyltransferase [Candidatus Ornithospirochaeta avicola]|uniref:GNAT family N-acetyltransferase n=1 Tax=Candidatus Ornithospirochaeta avicola TaxID=2840896 RepID=A0A9D1PSS0_9SPIO|nr:GNAT family N-acetyltransferase [Candidatus Ornithospirochaeta avicola]